MTECWLLISHDENIWWNSYCIFTKLRNIPTAKISQITVTYGNVCAHMVCAKISHPNHSLILSRTVWLHWVVACCMIRKSHPCTELHTSTVLFCSTQLFVSQKEKYTFHLARFNWRTHSANGHTNTILEERVSILYLKVLLLLSLGQVLYAMAVNKDRPTISIVRLFTYPMEKRNYSAYST